MQSKTHRRALSHPPSPLNDDSLLALCSSLFSSPIARQSRRRLVYLNTHHSVFGMVRIEINESEPRLHWRHSHPNSRGNRGRDRRHTGRFLIQQHVVCALCRGGHLLRKRERSVCPNFTCPKTQTRVRPGSRRASADRPDPSPHYQGFLLAQICV